MANKKDSESAPESVQETVQEYDPWRDMVSVNLPRKERGEQQFQFVAVNGRRYQVPCGQSVMVPRPVYEVLANAAAARNAAEKRKEELMAAQYKPLRQM